MFIIATIEVRTEKKKKANIFLPNSILPTLYRPKTTKIPQKYFWGKYLGAFFHFFSPKQNIFALHLNEHISSEEQPNESKIDFPTEFMLHELYIFTAEFVLMEKHFKNLSKGKQWLFSNKLIKQNAKLLWNHPFCFIDQSPFNLGVFSSSFGINFWS